MREELISGIYSFLSSQGFIVKTFLDSNSCFDLIAKKGNQAFIVKVYSNIDSVREEQAKELLKLSSLFNALPVIVGKKSKAFDLRNEILYERFGVSVMTFNSFQETVKGHYPKIKFFKGKETVKLDYEKLREKRISLGLSSSELAERIQLNPETLYRYEKGFNASIDSAKKLENALNTSLIKEMDLNAECEKEENENKNNPLYDKFKRIGMELDLFSHAPIKAAEMESPILIQEGERKKDLIKKAIDLKKAGEVIESDSMILTREFPKKSIYSIPVIEEEELDSLRKKKDLIELIRERKKKRRGKIEKIRKKQGKNKNREKNELY
ncbi:MAG: helix-turn-helix domain-containing protein [Candidatus Diapherotrites archaeon]